MRMYAEEQRMGLQKRTYTLPDSVVAPFERTVPTGKRSAIVAGVLNAWLEERQREALRANVVEGCREMADVYLEIERDFHPLEEEVQHGLDANPAARRNRPRASGPRRRVGARR